MKHLSRQVDYSKRTIESFASYLDQGYDERCRTVLLQLGYAATVVDVILNPATYEILSLPEDGHLKLPFDETDPRIGVVTVQPDEEFRITTNAHPYQEMSFRGTSPAHIARKYCSAMITNAPVERLTEQGDSLVTIGRPTLVLVDDKRPHGFASVMLHEAVHIAQQLTRPEITYSQVTGDTDYLVDVYNNEFDAYDAQCRVFWDNLDFILDGTMSMSYAISSFRKKQLGDDRVTTANINIVRNDPAISRIAG